jgi:hypothetical protein
VVGISLVTIEKRSAAERWTEQRSQVREEIRVIADASSRAEAASALVTFRRGQIGAIGRVLQGASSMLTSQQLSPQDLRSVQMTIRDNFKAAHEAAGIEMVATESVLPAILPWHLLRGIGEHRPSQKILDCIPEEEDDLA